MKLKFGIVGPSGCGKTLIANILGNEMNMDNSIGRPPYRPTNSVRIVEFSVPNVDLRKYTTEVDAQIWEIGGNPRLKSIWPGVQNNLDGIILVYDTNNELHHRDMSALHMHFVTHSNLNQSQCLIIGNQFRGTRECGPAKIVGVGPRVRHFVVNVDDDPNYLRDEFKHFLTGVAQITNDQEKNPNMPNGSFMMTYPKENGGQSKFWRENSNSSVMEQGFDQSNPAYYQPYAEFHNARSNNRTRGRKCHNKSDPGGGGDSTMEMSFDSFPHEEHNPSNEAAIGGFITKPTKPFDDFCIHKRIRKE